MRISPVRSLALAAFAYAVVGVVTADFALAAGEPTLRSAWRLAAWVLSFVIFAAQLFYERKREGATIATVARDVAVAAAIGAFILAIVGPVRSHWSAGDFRRAAVLSLVAWPLLVGIPAYVTALVIGFVIDRLTARGDSPAT